MSYVIFGIICISFVFAILNDNMQNLSVVALTSCKDAVLLCIELCGTLCFWSGIMNVAKKSGIVSRLSKLFAKPLALLFPDINKNGTAMEYIIFNCISNLLGLGNASTPLGIRAMQELKTEQKAKNTATRSMIMLVVLNTASIQLFPSTIIAIRASYGSISPSDILPCVWSVSVFVLIISAISVFTFDKLKKFRKKPGQ